MVGLLSSMGGVLGFQYFFRIIIMKIIENH